ncbi:hypothetical protein M0802_016974 [Mischocyttarus mexicanus]|nr:hypothetical protein M0802_016974 [Mischocyttarus mexicanus]
MILKYDFLTSDIFVCLFLFQNLSRMHCKMTVASAARNRGLVARRSSGTLSTRYIYLSFRHLSQRPKLWEKLSKKYDPNGEYQAKFKNDAEKHGIKL